MTQTIDDALAAIFDGIDITTMCEDTLRERVAAALVGERERAEVEAARLRQQRADWLQQDELATATATRLAAERDAEREKARENFRCFEQMQHAYEAERQRAVNAEAERDAARADVTAAAGELVVPIPEPGSDMARVMIANRLLKAERNTTIEERDEERERLRDFWAALVDAGMPNEDEGFDPAAWWANVKRERDAAVKRAEAAEARVAAAIAALDKRRSDGSDDCHCRACERIREDTAGTFVCELCGYHGTPLVMECTCYDRSCLPGANGAGCFHGSLGCPACDDNNSVSGFEIVRDARAALGDDAKGGAS